MATKIEAFKNRLKFLKAPLLIILILMGFVLEFVVELPFRILAMASDRRR